ncbi:hypothetical protein ABPG72_021104 [Tetrahymena utriculariae]
MSESITCNTNQAVYSNYFPNQTKKNFRNFSQKKLPLEKQTSVAKKYMISSKTQSQSDEYQSLNKRLLEGFLKLRKQILQSENQTSDEKDLRNSNAKQIVNLEGSSLSSLNQYEPLANIKLKQFKRNLKKNQIQSYQKNKNVNTLSIEQKCKYSLFDNPISKYSYKAVNLSSQFNLNTSQEDPSKLSSQIYQNCDQKCIDKQHIQIQQNDNKKNNFKTKTLKQKSLINKKSKEINYKSKNENSSYNLQSNELSTKMSFYTMNKSDSKADKIRYSQNSFFQDYFINQEETQNFNQSRSISPQLESSFIFNSPKETHQELNKINQETNLKQKLQKIKLNLCRPKSQDSVIRLKPFYFNIHQKDQVQFVENVQVNQQLINHQVDKKLIQPHQQQDILSIKIENQIEEIKQGYGDIILNNHDKKIEIQMDSNQQMNKKEGKEQQERKQNLQNKQNKEIIQIKPNEIEEQKQLFKKQESKESIQKFKLFQIEIDQQTEQTQFDAFNSYLSQNAYFLGKKLKNSIILNSKNSTSKIFCRKSMSSYKLSNQQNLSLNKFFNEQTVDQLIHSQKPTELNFQDVFCSQEQTNRVQHQQQKKHPHISQRKYSYDNSQLNKNTRFFEIQMMSYQPIGLVSSDNMINMQTQNYFNKQLIINSLGKSQIVNYEGGQ